MDSKTRAPAVLQLIDGHLRTDVSPDAALRSNRLRRKMPRTNAPTPHSITEDGSGTAVAFKRTLSNSASESGVAVCRINECSVATVFGEPKVELSTEMKRSTNWPTPGDVMLLSWAITVEPASSVSSNVPKGKSPEGFPISR